MNEPHWDHLIHAHLDGSLTESELAEFEAVMLESASARCRFWELAEVHGLARESARLAWVHDESEAPVVKSPTRKWTGWFTWRPLTAAAAGIVLGMFCTSVVFAYARPKSPAVQNKVLSLTDADFESGSQVPAQGIPSRAGAWSGDFSRVVETENGIAPKHGQHMLRFLRSDNERSSKNEHSYVGSVAQVIDLRPLRAELADSEQLVEVSAQFNSIPTPPSERYEFAVKAAAFRGAIADAPKLWEDHEASVSRSDRTVVADSDTTTWQRVAVPLVVPPDADFLVIECAVVFKGAQVQGATEFPGHYVDQVEVQFNSSARAWTEAR